MEEPNCYMKKEGSKREHGPTFCFDFWVRFGDHRALYHIPIVIIPTLIIAITNKQFLSRSMYAVHSGAKCMILVQWG